MENLGTYLTIAENVVRDHLGKSIPIFMDVKITYRCNCLCKFCNCWKREHLEELKLEEHKSLIDQAKALGVRVISYEGGEPLLREDLPEILKYAKKKVADIEFSPEDASRSEKAFLYRILEEVIKA